MTRDELAVHIARDYHAGAGSFEALRQKYAAHYTGRRADGPTRGWIARLKRRGEMLLAGADGGAEPPAAHAPEEPAFYHFEPHDAISRRPARRVYLRAAVVDIETTDFQTEGFAGYLICCCILPLDAETPHTLTIRYEEFGDDRRLLCDVRDTLAEYDIVIGHNWSAFDSNWLQSKLMYYGMRPLRTHYVFDTYQIVKTMGLKTRKSLGNLIDYFHLVGVKTTIYRRSWHDIRHPVRARFEEALAGIVYHCEQDVLANRALLDVLFPYALSMGANPFKISKIRHMDWNHEHLAS